MEGDNRTVVRIVPRAGSVQLNGTLNRVLHRGVAVFDDLVFETAGSAVLDFTDVTNRPPVDASRVTGLAVSVVDRPWSLATIRQHLLQQGVPSGGPLDIRDVNGDGMADLVQRGVFLQQPQTNGEFARSAVYSALPGTLIDLNGDGFADQMVRAGGELRIAFQDPAQPGTFGAPVASPVNAGILGVGNLDGDRLLDVAVLHDDVVDTYVQDGSSPGRLLPRVTVRLPRTNVSSSGWIGIVDTDGDAFHDLLVNVVTRLSSGGSFNSILRVRQDPRAPGSFLSPQLIDEPIARGGVIDLAAQDVTGDGLPDAVYVHNQAAYYHDAFGPRSQWRAAGRIRFADVDADGHPDAVVYHRTESSSSSSTGFLTIHRVERGRPGPSAPNATLPVEGIIEYAVGDVNGDGRADLALSIAETSSKHQLVGISLQDPALEEQWFPWPRLIQGPGFDPIMQLRLVADVNRDGESDYLLATNRSLQIARNLPGLSLSFETPEDITLPLNIDDLAVGDLDGDRWPDVVVATSGALLVFRNDPAAAGGKGRFVMASVLRGGFTRVRVVDIDGDQRPDLVFQNLQQRLGCYFRDPAGTFREPAHEFQVDSGSCSFAFDDLDRDGRAELVLLYRDRVTVLVQAGAPGSFGAPVTTLLDLRSDAADLAIGDVDGDGNLDLVLADRGVAGFHVLRMIRQQNAPLRFERDSYPMPLPTWRVELLDVDGDCRPEVLTLPVDVAVATLAFLGAASGHLRELRHFGSGQRSMFPWVSDLDGDGISDLVLSKSIDLAAIGLAILGR